MQKLIKEKTHGNKHFRIWFDGAYHVSMVDTCGLSESIGFARTQEEAEQILHYVIKGMDIADRADKTTKAERILSDLRQAHGCYDYKIGFPRVFDNDPYTFIADGKLLKESAKKDGPFYVRKYVKADETFIFEEDGTIYKVKGIEDIETYLKGNKKLLEKEEREIIYC